MKYKPPVLLCETDRIVPPGALLADDNVQSAKPVLHRENDRTIKSTDSAKDVACATSLFNQATSSDLITKNTQTSPNFVIIFEDFLINYHHFIYRHRARVTHFEFEDLGRVVSRGSEEILRHFETRVFNTFRKTPVKFTRRRS